MSKEKQIEIPENEMGRSGYSNYSWKLWKTKKFTMAQAELADQIMREEGYRKQSEGKWIRKDGFFVCSVCDTTKPFAVLNDNIHYFAGNYCHKCGAKMKGGAE